MEVSLRIISVSRTHVRCEAFLKTNRVRLLTSGCILTVKPNIYRVHDAHLKNLNIQPQMSIKDFHGISHSLIFDPVHLTCIHVDLEFKESFIDQIRNISTKTLYFKILNYMNIT